MEDLDRVLERVKAHGVDAKDAELLEAVVSSYGYMTQMIRDKQTTIAHLRKMLFGSTSEKKDDVLGRVVASPAAPAEGVEGAPSPTSEPSVTILPKAPAPGHGRNGAQAYVGPSPRCRARR